MARAVVNILVLLIAIAGGIHQFYLEPFLKQFGKGRIIESLNNKDCIKVPELTACEKIVLHQPTGNIYLSCSTPSSRVHWTPTVDRLNATGASRNDYVALYNPSTSTITRFRFEGYTSDRGLSLHGMDVVPSVEDPSKLYVYLINHRAPLGDKPATEVGADSAVELFWTTVGGDTLTYITTIEDRTIITPNDLVGSPDGKSFWFTNDHGEKTGFKRELDIYLGRKSTSVGYCHLDKGCKLAITGMHGNNGIAQASNGTIYVANSLWGGLSILEPQSDHSLVLVDHIKTDRGMDNVAVDSNGNVWAAGFSNAFDLLKYFGDPTHPSPSSALRFSINTGPNAFYGEKYKIEKLFEDDGSLASGITSVVYDAERNRLFLDGLSSPQLVVCKL